MRTFRQKLQSHRGKLLLLAAMTSVLLVWALNRWVVRSVDNRVFAQIEALPKNDVGLVLGCSKHLASGRINLHFQARIEAASALYHAGKVKHLLLSGDNHRVGYDEPTDMKESLMALGVPAEAITLDYAGFRTLDSVVRAREVFGRTKLTLVTDDFHAHRAVFLAKHKGVEAVAFSAQPVAVNRSARSRVREVVARVKAVADLFVFHTKPKFLGEKIEMQIGNRSQHAESKIA
jgi:SanA protein